MCDKSRLHNLNLIMCVNIGFKIYSEANIFLLQKVFYCYLQNNKILNIEIKITKVCHFMFN